MNLLKFISNLFNRDNSHVNTLKVDEETRKQNWDIKFNDLGIFRYNSLGFDIDQNNEFYSIKWSDIERLTAYKADLLTTDEVCIDITFDNRTILITEETKGWYQFIEKVKSAFPRFKY